LGLGYLALAVNLMSAYVTAFITISYLLFYTPLKRRSSLCMWSAPVPGPAAGYWMGGDARFIGRWSLGFVSPSCFFGKYPHTLAIARLYREDYAKAGIMFLPVIEPEGGSSNRQIVSHSAALLAVSLLPTLLGIAGGVYFVVAFALGVGFIGAGITLTLNSTLANARRLLFASLVYLPVLLLVMALDRTPL
jgi:protoheme IX farnesyltransferase